MKIIECPRDAWQGQHSFIPTAEKIAYLNKLLQVGFDTIDFGSFVSPKAMPQVADTSAIVDKLDLDNSSSKLLAIVANERGALEASQFDKITYLGYPFSVSETFQLRNTNASINDSLSRVSRIADICMNARKQMVVYISMGFGNPYGDVWNPEIVMQCIEKLRQFEVKIFSLSDTVGVAKTDDIHSLFSQLIPQWSDLEFGAHFHTLPEKWQDKVTAAYSAGCRRFDGALLGYGGCPMAQDELIGNMPTERLIDFAGKEKVGLNLNLQAVDEAKMLFVDLISL